MIRAAALLFFTCAAAIPARADFVVTGTPALPDRVRPTPQRGYDSVDAPAPVAVRFKIASGFGHQVPLSFAVRQIVPAGVDVSYGLGANPNALVNWKGGAPWNDVLRASVKPIGLRILLTDLAVQIRK